MKKKMIKFLLAVASILAIAVFLVVRYSPQPVVGDPAKAQVQSVRYHQSPEPILLDAVQEKTILNLLSNYKCRRSMKSYFPFHGEDADYELTLHTDTKIPWHILIGKINICYVSSDQGAFEIIDAQNLSTELKAIVG
jgi:hypothetical protein